jgi:hypothetical protein
MLCSLEASGDNVQTPSSSECNTLSSEPFRIGRYVYSFVRFIPQVARYKARRQKISGVQILKE